MDNFKYVQNQPTTLAGAGASLGDTSLTLTSFLQIDGSTTLTMTNFGTIGYGTIEPNNGTQEEQISFTGIVQNANGTATLTGVKTVLFISPYTESSGLAKTHPGGVQFVVSNTAGFYNKMTSKDDDETILGTYTFTNPNYPRMDTATPAPTDSEQLATKKYVDDTAVAGAPNATTTVKGIVELATAAETAAGTTTGGTGANLVPQNSTFNATSSAAVLVPVTNASGKLAAGFGGAASSLATLDAGSLVVQNPANATATPTASKIPIADANGTLNSWVTGDVQVYVAGENIDASSVPKALYLKESDGRVYKLDATAASEAAYAFVGFAIIQAAVTTGNSITVQQANVVSGFSALSIGAYYYGTNTAGTISTTAGTISLQIGRAVTATTLLIQVGKKVATGNQSFGSTTTASKTIGFKPNNIIIHAVGNNNTSGSFGTWNPTNGNNCVYWYSVGTASNVVNAGWFAGSQPGVADNHGNVTSITTTGFTLDNTNTGGAGIVSLLFWQAEA